MLDNSNQNSAFSAVLRAIAFIPKVLIPVFLIVVTIYCGRAMGLAVYQTYFEVPNEMKVPRITGMGVEEAKKVLQALNLGIDVQETRFSAKVERDGVIEQFPPAGRDMREGSNVAVVVSLGADTVTVPSLVDKSFSDAQIDLNNAKLVLGKVTRVAKNKNDPELVLDQNPKPGVAVKKGTKVNLMVNIGNEARVKVPSFANQTIDRVRDAASWSNLKLGTVGWVVSDSVGAGMVISQEPAADKEVEPGTEVDIKVSLGNAQTHAEIKQRIVQVRTPDVTGLQQIRVAVTDETGTYTAYEGTHAQGELVNVYVTAMGRGEYQVYSNDKLVTRAKI